LLSQRMLFAVVAVALLASVHASSFTCTCTNAASSSFACSTFISECQALSGSSSCNPGSTGAYCSFSASCVDATTGLTTCNSYCSVATGVLASTYSCSSGSSCFPANATVSLADGSTKTMSALEIGDKVLTENGEYSDVYMFSHRLTDSRSAFVRIAAGGHSLMLTANHYLYVNDKLAVASTVKVGDKVKGHDGSDITVTSVEAAWADGLYNPHTMNGDIVVDGILTSTYTSDINPSLAHAALWPVRMLHSLGQNVVGEAFHAGSELLASVLPDGKARY